MKLGRGVRLTIGGLTLFLAVSPFLFMGFIFLMLFGMLAGVFIAESGGEPPMFMVGFPFLFMFVIFPLQFVYIFLQFGLQVFYFIHLLKNTAAPEAARILLGLGIFFMPFLAMPIYYLMYIWREPATDAAIPPAPPAPPLAQPV
jgi:hypothetical protein